MDKLVFPVLAGLVALAPLPFGSNRLWSWSLVALLAGLLLLAWAVTAWRQSAYDALPFRRYAPALLGFSGALAWALIQPLPGLAPHPLWTEAGAALAGISPHAAISLDPGASLTGAMRLLAYGAVFWLSLQTCRDAGRANRLLWTVAISGTVYALYGLIVEFAGLDSVLWYRKWAYADSVTSTFVNRNSFATYAGMASIVALALLAHEVDRARTEAGSAVISLVDTIDAMSARAYALVGCLIVIGTALLLTESRAGIASTVIGLSIFLTAHAIYRRRRGGVGGGWFIGAALLVVTVLVVVSGRGVVDRLNLVEHNLAGREAVWQITREATAQRPLAGNGLGTFDDIYLANRDERLPLRTRPFEYAHNSYYENMLELGIPAALALAAAIGWLGLWCAWGVAVRRRHGIYPCVALSVLCLAAAHAWFDFSLQIPAVAICLAALLGAGCAQANRTAAHPSRPDDAVRTAG